MARIAGVNIPTNKRVEIALTYIHGIGRTKAREITQKLGIAPERRVQDLTDQEVLQIRETIDAEHSVEGDLRREVAMNIKRLMDLASYRGLRNRVRDILLVAGWGRILVGHFAASSALFTNSLQPLSRDAAMRGY